MSPIRHANRTLGTRTATIGGLLAGATLAGCSERMSILAPAGRGAERIASVAWMLIGIGVTVLVIVTVVMLIAVFRHRGQERTEVDQSVRSRTPVIVLGGIVPALILVMTLVVGLLAMRHFSVAETRPPQFTVIGHQWWWEVRYEGGTLQQQFRTANEIHIPVGEVIPIRLISGDVIHSFWVPRLQGKLDLIPGDTNEIRLFAERPGTYRGQCAEYCGLQHAHMAFTVVAESPTQYRAWLASQQQPARPPSDSVTQLGEQLVSTGPCALCHTIRGTEMYGDVAPDLSHIGSRLTLAAGAYSNDVGTMTAWISNARALKPGTRMPSIHEYSGSQLMAMATYLETLK